MVRCHAFHYRYDTALEMQLLDELYQLVRVRLNLFTATTKGNAEPLVDSLTCPMVWFPVGVTSFRRILVAECERGRIRGVLRN
ncbi:hypothetical protein ADILRU_1136 [Leifsonia rubra CMS 76R]|nr:hypothetical protein ADILRU_1136 [Leifsonia rubra CMS 76R]